MKFSHLLITACFTGLLLSAVPATAAEPDAKPAPQGADTGPTWTDADVKRMCTNRFPKKPIRYNTCLDRNKGKIGMAKSADDIKMIQTGKRPGAAIAAPKMTKIPEAPKK